MTLCDNRHIPLPRTKFMPDGACVRHRLLPVSASRQPLVFPNWRHLPTPALTGLHKKNRGDSTFHKKECLVAPNIAPSRLRITKSANQSLYRYYLISMARWVFFSSSFVILGITIVRTPFSTLAEMFSLATLSGKA